MKLKRFLKNWRLERAYGSTRRRALRSALRSLRRELGPTAEDLVAAYRRKEPRYSAPTPVAPPAQKGR